MYWLKSFRGMPALHILFLEQTDLPAPESFINSTSNGLQFCGCFSSVDIAKYALKLTSGRLRLVKTKAGATGTETVSGTVEVNKGMCVIASCAGATIAGLHMAAEKAVKRISLLYLCFCAFV